MRIVLLGLEFYIGNKGCEALTESFIGELNKIAEEYNIKFEIEAFVMKLGERLKASGQITEINLSKIEPKKYSFWKHCRKIFSESDMIIDFSMGDSFSDIYGVKRFAIYSVLKELAVRADTPFVLGPQTYGPFNRKWVRKWAVSIIKRSDEVYTRDGLSQKYVYDLCGRNIVQVTDVAFALPYQKAPYKKSIDDKIKVGINVSGLLWKGGYTGKNQFQLRVDYQLFCIRIIEDLLESEKYEVFLIPHVGDKTKQGISENDYIPCMELMKKFSNLELVDSSGSPSIIKGEIARMDIFIGARMHATIAAFSSGVATIPFSYSRKFEGLYQSLGYPYVIEATKFTTDEAIITTKNYIRHYEKLQAAGKESMNIVEQKQRMFRQGIGKIFCENICEE